MTYSKISVQTRDNGSYRHEDCTWNVIEGALYIFKDERVIPSIPNIIEVAVYAAGQWIAACRLP